MIVQFKDYLVDNYFCILGFFDVSLLFVVSNLKLQKFVFIGVGSLFELFKVYEIVNYLGNRVENRGKLEFFIARLFIVKVIRDYMRAFCFSYFIV